jgi:hypothetical protein
MHNFLLADGNSLEQLFPGLILIVVVILLISRIRMWLKGRQRGRIAPTTRYTMRNWKILRSYCRGCGTWSSNVSHGPCSRGAVGSRIFVDIEHFELGCNKCGKTWLLENNVTRCTCGHVQETEFADSAVVIEAGDQIIASDGDMVYVLRRSGTVVVGRRSYLDVSYED